MIGEVREGGDVRMEDVSGAGKDEKYSQSGEVKDGVNLYEGNVS